MFDAHSIHAAATDKVAVLAAETATRAALDRGSEGAHKRVRRNSKLFWALRLLTP